MVHDIIGLRTDVASELQICAAVVGREAGCVTVAGTTTSIVGTRSVDAAGAVLPWTAESGAETTALWLRLPLAARPR